MADHFVVRRPRQNPSRRRRDGNLRSAQTAFQEAIEQTCHQQPVAEGLKAFRFLHEERIHKERVFEKVEKALHMRLARGFGSPLAGCGGRSGRLSRVERGKGNPLSSPDTVCSTARQVIEHTRVYGLGLSSPSQFATMISLESAPITKLAS